MARIRHLQELIDTGEGEPGEPEAATAETPEQSEQGRQPRPRRMVLLPRRRTAVIGAGALAVVAVVVLALVGTGVIGSRGRAAAVPTVGFSPNAEDGASAAQQTGQAFLAAWQHGNLHAAADITDNPSAAYAALVAYQRDLSLSGMTFQPNGVGSAGWLTFSVAAQVGTPASTWSYTSGLAAYQGTADAVPRWFVKWSPAILFTSLKAGQHLALGSIAPTASGVVDATGQAITAADAPSLANLLTGIQKNAGTTSGGRPGTTVEVEAANGSVVATAATVAQPVNAAAVRTTLSLSAQAAAQAAADRAPNSSVAVIQPSTGDILAIANNPPTGVDTAMIGALAPGSTFKVVSTTTLLDHGLVTNLDQPVPCPQALDADGITLHNSEQEAGPDNDFLQDFAQSCNNAFSSFYQKVGTSDIAATARQYFGFNEPWDVGLHQPTTYANVPDAPSDSSAEEMVGQDRITTSPLAMASVAATVANGSFKQPILIPGTPQTAATPLPANDLNNLRTLMHAVITQGTLTGVIGDASDSYGKTGTAEVGTNNNSWTIAYRGDFAVCALAVDGGFGASVAGPEVNSVLQTLSP